MFGRLAAVACSAMAIGAMAAASEAQPLRSRFYAGGSIGSFSISADHVDGRATSAGVIVGAALKPWFDVEGELVIPAGDFTRSHTGLSVSFAPPGSSREEIERLGVTTRFDRSRDVSSSVSAVARFHPTGDTRVVPSFVVGVTNQRVRDRTIYTPLAVPEGVDPNHPSVRAREESVTRNLGGPTVGASVAITITDHLVLAPDVRFDYGSIGDEINNALRASMRVWWRF